MKFITPFSALLLLVFSLQLLTGCAAVAFPDPVATEMEEDPNPQTNNFL